MRRALALVFFVLASGCTVPDSGHVTEPPASSPPHTVLANEGPAPPPISKMPLAISVAVADHWVKPSDTILVNATAPQGAVISWYVAPRNPFVPGDDENVDLVPRSLGVVTNGSASLEAIMRGPGRYSYALKSDPSIGFNVTVLSYDTRTDPAEVGLLRDEFGLRFAPSELVTGPSAAVSVRSHVDLLTEIVRTDQMWSAAPSAFNASITPPALLGDYDIVALARDPVDGWGQASERIVVDARKPDAEVTLTPLTGIFTTSIGAPQETNQASYSARFDFEVLYVNWTTSSDATVPPSVRVSLLDANGTLLLKKEAASGTIEARGAPHAGILRVEALSGLRVTYNVTAEGRMALVPPGSLFNH